MQAAVVHHFVGREGRVQDAAHAVGRRHPLWGQQLVPQGGVHPQGQGDPAESARPVGEVATVSTTNEPLNRQTSS